MKNAQDSQIESKKISKPKKKNVAKRNANKGKIAGWMTFLREVRAELRKVTWPPRREIVSSTSALIVATLLIGLFLGIVDFILAKGIQPALTGNAGAMSVATVILFIGILLWVFKSN